MTTPAPEEFSGRPDSYEGIPAMWTRVTVYKDGQLLYGQDKDQEPLAAEQAPGWTVQGARRGETP